MESQNNQLNQEKLKELVLYICQQANQKDFGATKLNKILWFADRTAYLTYGSSITGETYVKRQFGPAPKHLLRMQDELIAAKRLETREVQHFGKIRREFRALSPVDFSHFSAGEISLVDEIIQIICDKFTARSISEASHDDIWEMAQMGEEIPYCTVFADELGEIDDADMRWANSVIAGNGVAHA